MKRFWMKITSAIGIGELSFPYFAGLSFPLRCYLQPTSFNQVFHTILYLSQRMSSRVTRDDMGAEHCVSNLFPNSQLSLLSKYEW